MDNYKSGGRTRNIINIANVGGGGTVAFAFTAATAVPGLATDGFANWGTQKNLHVAIGYSGGSGTCQFVIWGYHSFSGEWGLLNIIDPADGGNNPITISVTNNTKVYSIVPIEGLERVYIQCTSWGTGGAAGAYLGVNTI